MFDLGSIIDKEFILNRVSQEEIFEKYLEINVEFGKRFTNPFRKDDHPDCYFNYTNNGILKFIDFARGWSWDCFNVVQKAHNNCSFKEALLIINRDFNLSDKDIDRKLIERIKLIKQTPRNTKIEVKIRTIRTYDLAFWEKFEIDQQALQYYKVFAVEYAWITTNELDRELIYRYKGDNNLAYYYAFSKNSGQLYLPFKSKDKTRFYITDSNVVMGYNQLELQGDFVIITKSYKDVMSMNRFYIPAVSVPSESQLLNSRAIPILSKRFKTIFTLFDPDKQGKIITIKHRNKYKTTPLLFPEDHEKDFSDNVAKFGYKYMNDLVDYYKELLL